jgi:hypothetical protein
VIAFPSGSRETLRRELVYFFRHEDICAPP